MTTRRIAASGGTDRLPPNGNTPLTTKGDLYTYSTTQARLAVGNDGETLVADSAASTGLRWQGNFAAGKNKIINGDFNIWQRGTSSSTNSSFVADRWKIFWDGNGTFTCSQQTFTPGTAPVAGYEGTYFQRIAMNTAGTSTFYQTMQLIENARTLAGETFTISFWAKANTNTTLSVYVEQNFGSGGSATTNPINTTVSLTTAWQRFTITGTMTSISGKTIGTNSFVQLTLRSFSLGAGASFDLWGVQVESGSVATAFQTATGTLAGELAACQRYYYRNTPGSAYGQHGFGSAYSTNQWQGLVQLPVSMRITPTTLESGNVKIADGANTPLALTLSLVASQSSPNVASVQAVVSGATQYRPYFLQNDNNTAGYVGFSAEL